MILDDIDAIQRIDRHDVRGVLAGFPAQCRRARELRASPAVAVAPWRGLSGRASG